MDAKRTFPAGMDIFKLVAAFFVIGIHTGPFYEYNEMITFFIVRVFARLAVPYFFMCAGFFFVAKSNKYNPKQYIKHYVYHISKLYLLWSFVYFFDRFPLILKDSKNSFEAVGLYIWNFIFIDSYYHLWFLPALLVAMLFLYIAYVNHRIGMLVLVALSLNIIGLFGDSYYGLLGDESIFRQMMDAYLGLFHTTRNGVFFGALYVALGGYIGNSTTLMKSKILYAHHLDHELSGEAVEKRIVFIFLLCITLLSIEAIILHFLDSGRDYNMYLFLIPTGISFFLLVKEFNIYTKKETSLMIRWMSMYVFFIHPMFILLFKAIASQYGLTNVYTPEFVFVSGMSVVSGLIFLGIKKRLI